MIGAAQEDNAAMRRKVKSKSPTVGVDGSWWSSLLTKGEALTVSRDVSGRLVLNSRQGRVLEPGPDLGLPAAVVAFDGGLEARFSRRDKDGNHSQAEADASDAAQRVGPAVSSVEPTVVIELGVGGQAELAPVLDESVNGLCCGDAVAHPGAHQSAVKRDGVEHLDIDSAFKDKAGDDVKAVQLGLTLRHPRQIPPSWRSRMADPAPVVENPSPQQDTSNGANGRQGLVVACQQLAMDGRLSKFPQVTLLLQLLTHPKDFNFDGSCDSIGRTVRPARPVAPVHAIQPLVTGPQDPSLNRSAADTEPPRHPADRMAVTNRSHQRAALALTGVFFSSSMIEASCLRSISPFSCSSLRVVAMARAPQAVEADGVWKAAEDGTFPHPLENASRFPQLPQPNSQR